ncbi:MAG: deoxyribose-phosphate aldolase [Candidatus Bathyarchaeia archaeon]
MKRELTREQLAKTIDHTLLKPTATKDDIVRLCEEARRYGFASVCVSPYYVPLAANLLRETGVKVCTVIGFPLGATAPEVKIFEAEDAIRRGAREVDIVINLGALKSGDYALVRRDVEGVVRAAKPKDVATKVIIEACFLTDEEKVKACTIAREAGADFVKTSTGFGSGGATVHDVELMRRTVGREMRVKAAGGIRTFEQAMSMIEAGATRIGASAGVAIVEGYKPINP